MSSLKDRLRKIEQQVGLGCFVIRTWDDLWRESFRRERAHERGLPPAPVAISEEMRALLEDMFPETIGGHETK